ncbi:MAG: hypothetical protein GEU88_12975 [Solirubrobacterales bacterium]|nr:hypothetical protein [Solirubrobacterales bacterium]
MSPLARRRAAGRTTEAPAPFVVGVGRSGTTLLRLMLDAHPRLAIPAETHFVPALIERAKAGGEPDALLGEILSARNWGDFGLDPETLRARIATLDGADPASVLRGFYRLYADARSKPRWGDKTPGYVKRMRIIGEALGEARFVHLIRDGRDVALSRRGRGMGAEKPIADVADRWRRRIEAARRSARRLRGRYLELRYEDLVADPEPVLRRVCELVELDYDPAMLRYHERAEQRLREMSGDLPAAGGRRGRSGEERMAAHALTSRPPAGDRVGGWRERMSATERAEFEAVAGGLLAELGYDVPSS